MEPPSLDRKGVLIMPEGTYLINLTSIPPSLIHEANKENSDPNQLSVAVITESKSQLNSFKQSGLGDCSPYDKVKSILTQVHSEFRNLLHLSEIIPALNARSLLTTNEVDTLQGSATTKQEKVDKLLLEILPRKGLNILRELIDCLHESKAGTGSAHTDLAKKLEVLMGTTTCHEDSIVKVERKLVRPLGCITNCRNVEQDSGKIVSNQDTCFHKGHSSSTSSEAQVSSHSSLPPTKKPRYDVNKENCHQKLRQSLIKEYLMPEKN